MILQESFFQGKGDTLDLFEDNSNVDEDYGIQAYLGEPSCKYGALHKLATTVETVETWMN